MTRVACGHSNQSFVGHGMDTSAEDYANPIKTPGLKSARFARCPGVFMLARS